MALARRSGQLDALTVALFERAGRLVGCGRADELLAVAEELASAPVPRTPGGVHPLRGGLRMRAIARLTVGDRAGYEVDRAAYEQVCRDIRAFTPHDQLFPAILLALLDGRWAEAEALLRRRQRHPLTFGGIGIALQWAQFGLGQGRTGEVLPGILAALEEGPWDRTLRAMVARSYLDLGDVA
ncbi:MAG: hypothetical protein M3276_04825, partial [Actinomycetota bacterium]|nr:hypothetical protein [Actinomycetota bacterium]